MTWKDPAMVVLGCAVVLLLLRPGPAPEPDPEAPARTEALIEDLTARGWAVVRPEAVGDLTRALVASRDTSDALRLEVADLAARVRFLGGRVQATAELLAQAQTELELLADVQETPQGHQATASWDDGTFFGSVVYREEPPEPALFHFPELGARIRGAVVASEGPDGSILFSAIAEDSRASLTIEAARYTPPPPVEFCGWGTRLRWGLGGAGVGFVSVLLRTLG